MGVPEQLIILSEAQTSLSEIYAESKDLYYRSL